MANQSGFEPGSLGLKAAMLTIELHHPIDGLKIYLLMCLFTYVALVVEISSNLKPNHSRMETSKLLQLFTSNNKL